MKSVTAPALIPYRPVPTGIPDAPVEGGVTVQTTRSG